MLKAIFNFFKKPVAPTAPVAPYKVETPEPAAVVSSPAPVSAPEAPKAKKPAAKKPAAKKPSAAAKPKAKPKTKK